MSTAIAADAGPPPMPLKYQQGFGNQFTTEALPGALPEGRNSPQRCPYGLYAEQFSGTAFTAPRQSNRRSWLYRIHPAAVLERPFRPLPHRGLAGRFDSLSAAPNPLRWSPPPIPREPLDFVDGLLTLGGTGSPETCTGCGIHWYLANRPMRNRFFYDADGELLIVPQLGRLRVATELGIIEAAPQEVLLIPRGQSFRTVRRAATSARASGRRCACPTWGPSARMASPIRAISGRPSPGTRTARARWSWWRSSAASCGARRSITPRSMWWPGTATTPPASMTCAVSTPSAP